MNITEDQQYEIWEYLYESVFTLSKRQLNLEYRYKLFEKNKSIDFYNLTYTGNVFEDKPKCYAWHCLIVHEFQSFNDIELIARNGHKKFKDSFDELVQKTIDMIIPKINNEKFRIVFTILQPYEYTVEFIYDKNNYDKTYLRKSLCERNILFNLLVTDSILIKLYPEFEYDDKFDI